ncbi:MAG TPA: transposase [Pyrinomonadaceae bacterium]|nr:transposase [Pyrinomonadaceae bacterium]
MSLIDDPHQAAMRAAGWHTRGYLPHFDGIALPQFITMHLADSVPATVVQRWQKELSYMKEKPRKVWLEMRIEKYLDQGYGECFLRIPQVAKLVQDALLDLGRKRCRLFSWVIMPNHVHALLTRSEGDELEQILQSLKSFTAHEANKILQRRGKFWFYECYDRYIRNEKHFLTTIRYIENNPVKAKLCARPADWSFSSAWFRKFGKG